METAYLQTPIGYVEIKGDENGLTSITVFDEEKPMDIIPEALEDAVHLF